MIKKLLIIPIALIVLSLQAYSQDSDYVVSAIGQKVAEAYGIDSFDNIIEIEYTFNVKIKDKIISRAWIWIPKDNKVKYYGDGSYAYAEPNSEPFIYTRENISDKSDAIKEVDKMFINDQYWLLFPLHLVWDEGIRIEVENQKLDLPVGSGSSTKISVIYPDTGGYTPGDIYDLYLDDNNMITKWVYRRGGSDTPARITTWEDNDEFGPLTLSLIRRGPDDSFRVWFTNVGVKYINPDQ